MDSSGNGWISDAIRCYDYCTNADAHIISNSWGVYDTSNALQVRNICSSLETLTYILHYLLPCLCLSISIAIQRITTYWPLFDFKEGQMLRLWDLFLLSFRKDLNG